ncbi:TPA: carbohydrate-binding protein [Escherichia coli]|nr:carbohydrate-binding protein [Escherichia coli]
MSKIVRYQGDVRAFASDAQGMERTVFGGTNQADDLTSQITASFLRGWGIVGASEHPSLEDFNAAMYAMSQFIAYQHQMGVPEWHAEQEYHIGSICTHNGESYQSLQNANIGSQPPSAKWTPVLTSKNGLANLGIGETGKYDILPASRGGTGASTIAGALINLGLSDLVTAGLVQVESGTDFITAKIPFLSGGSKRFLMIHAIKATMPANNNGYNLTVTFPTAYDNAPIPILGSTVGSTSTTGGTTESMNISSVTKSGCIISSAWQTWSEGPVYLLTIGGVAA